MVNQWQDSSANAPFKRYDGLQVRLRRASYQSFGHHVFGTQLIASMRTSIRTHSVTGRLSSASME